MIYSRFGAELTLLSKTESVRGWVSVQATTGGKGAILDYNLGDLKADFGLNEINAAVAKLPLKAFESKSGPRRKVVEDRKTLPDDADHDTGESADDHDD